MRNGETRVVDSNPNPIDFPVKDFDLFLRKSFAFNGAHFNVQHPRSVTHLLLGALGLKGVESLLEPSNEQLEEFLYRASIPDC
ncbi:hypothetical protein COLO4_30501 [Corchorus olitorius]|uniref:Uncharacterized protein n=1 Tax=Corchorus olitorius TaxID=93759 RepID=A0A1R3H877_9ROSI|nr:hypothetical protein COLO4_30501 [Corchorus olitorius]